MLLALWIADGVMKWHSEPILQPPRHQLQDSGAVLPPPFADGGRHDLRRVTCRSSGWRHYPGNSEGRKITLGMRPAWWKCERILK